MDHHNATKSGKCSCRLQIGTGRTATMLTLGIGLRQLAPTTDDPPKDNMTLPWGGGQDRLHPSRGKRSSQMAVGRAGN